MRAGWRRLFALFLGACVRGSAGAPRPEPAQTPAEWLATIQPSADLQALLDRSFDAALARDSRLRAAKVGIALLDLAHGEPPGIAQVHGEEPIYPASVVKF